MLQGIVRVWNDDRGFGFVRGDDGRDYFFHRGSFSGGWDADLAAGQRLVFDAHAPRQAGQWHVACNAQLLCEERA